MGAVERGWIDLIVDRLAGWWSGLPWESCSYTVERVRIPVDDKVILAANLYKPTIPVPHGTILIRTSYGIGPFNALSNGRLFSSRGYVVLLAACRGTDPSDGQSLTENMPAVFEAADGHATISWMRGQPWYTGSFGTYGGSYLGYTQFAILRDPPKDIKAAVVQTGMHSFGAFAWSTGALESHILAWADVMTASKRGFSMGFSYIRSLPKTLKPLFDGVPLTKSIESHFKGSPPAWLEPMATCSDITKQPYSQMDHMEALERCSIPILQTAGLNDPLLSMVSSQHSILTKHNLRAYITIGPWSHLGAQRATTAESFRFLEFHLASRGPNPCPSTARVFVSGAGEWRNLPAWPPQPALKVKLYFGPDDSLSDQRPSMKAAHSAFQFDPRLPTPDIGLPRPFDDIIPGNYDDTSLARRPDVVTFTTSALVTDLDVCGNPSVDVYHESNSPDVDVLIRLSDVDHRGKSSRICEVYKRLDSARGAGPLQLVLGDCAHRFRQGHKARIIIAGGAHPAWIRNTGESGTGIDMSPRLHKVYHTRDAPSSLTLPIVL